MEIIPKKRKYQELKQQIKQKLEKIDYKEGVSKEEAITIAQNYLIEKGIDTDFIITKPKVDDGEYPRPLWKVIFETTLKVKMKSGYSLGLVYVDKKTGEVISFGGSPDL